MFATVAVLSNGRQKDDTKEHVQRESPLTSCALCQGRLAGPIFIHKICFRLCTCRFIFSLRGRRLKFKNLLLINQKIYVHGWVFVCYQYLGTLYRTVTPSGPPAFSLRDASCDVIDIEIMCRTFGSVIVVLFPICSFARGKGSLETMIYFTVFDCRHVFRSTLSYLSSLLD